MGLTYPSTKVVVNILSAYMLLLSRPVNLYSILIIQLLESRSLFYESAFLTDAKIILNIPQAHLVI